MRKVIFFALAVVMCVTISASADIAAWQAQAQATSGNVVNDSGLGDGVTGGTGYVFDGTAAIAYDYGQLNVSNTAHDDGSTIEVIFNLEYPTAHYDILVECFNWGTDGLFLGHEVWVSDEGPGGGLGGSYKWYWDWPHPSDTHVNDEDVHVVWRQNGDGTVIPGQTTAGSMNLFVNGVDLGNWDDPPYNNWWMNGGAGYLGGSLTHSAFVKGTVYGVATYDHALSDAEIAALYGKVIAEFVSNPKPSVGELGVAVDTDLKWDNPTDYAASNYALEFRTNDANWIDTGNTTTIATVTDLDLDGDPDTTEAAAPITLLHSVKYYWRVTSTDPNSGSPVDYVGSDWSFTTIGSSPVISSFDNVFTAMSLLPADLAAVVTDADNNVDSVSWEVLTDDWSYPAGAIASVTDTTGDLYAPTATFTADANGFYKVRLTVTDDDSNATEQVVEVRVTQTTCDLAQLFPGFAFDYYDVDEDCDVDLSDFAAFAAKWLDDTNATAQGTWEGAASYVPVVNGIPNGNFEIGSFAGWVNTSGTITDAGADVQEGSYAASFNDAGGVHGQVGITDLPVGDYSITLWYKGDLTELRCEVQGGTATVDVTSLPVSTYLEGQGHTLVSGTVASYTQYTIPFTVTEAGTAGFWVWGVYDGLGTAGFVDDFRLNAL